MKLRMRQWEDPEGKKNAGIQEQLRDVCDDAI